ncbi:MAG: hypothetical protein JMDDDDMK_03351 [Acidobacteria bacterium]|nr:hypothetical protein [Acidobacteriota bacterium]
MAISVMAILFVVHIEGHIQYFFTHRHDFQNMYTIYPVALLRIIQPNNNTIK